MLYQRLLATAYEWHNYGKSTIGNRSDIERVPIERLKAFYASTISPTTPCWWWPASSTRPKALELIEKYFGPIPKPTRKLDTTYTEEPPQDGERSVTLRRVGDVGLVGAVYHVPAGAASRHRGAGGSGRRAGQRPVGPALQSAGRDAQGDQRRRRRQQLARSGRVRSVRRSAQGRLARRGTRHACWQRPKMSAETTVTDEEVDRAATKFSSSASERPPTPGNWPSN